MSKFPFARNDAIAIDSQTDFVAPLTAAVENKAQLLRALKKALAMPDYFGHNWDALDECIQDLSWIPQRRVILLHAATPHLPHPDLVSYLSILRDGMMALSQQDRALLIGFPEETWALRKAWADVEA